MKRNWIIKDLPQTAELPGLPRLISRLLVQRGISTESAALEFLNPDYSRLFDPFLFSDMGISVERVWKAIDANQRIFIYADYDADAITAASVMFLALRKLGANAGCYIPDRFSEGYGINVEAIRKLKEQGAELVISVDCGINSREEALEAKKLGMDLIITDHHELVGELPEAFAVINPKNPMDNYPFPFLTGVGVAFKLVQGLFSKEEKLKALGLAKGWEKWLLDLV
ncbi:MAG: DHH family phosphoesterase, partial [Acidobacteriaceae bacterium]